MEQISGGSHLAVRSGLVLGLDALQIKFRPGRVTKRAPAAETVRHITAWSGITPASPLYGGSTGGAVFASSTPLLGARD